MTAPAVISGSYADLKTIRTRQCLQMIIEVPLEDGEKLIDAFGFPCPGAEIRVAVARLAPGPHDVKTGEIRQNSGVAASNNNALDVTSGSGPDPLKSERSRQAYANSSEGEKAVTRAAMLCSEPEFQRWIGATDETEAAALLRQALDIGSRRAIAFEPRLEAFKVMEMEFAIATGRSADPR